MTWCRNHGPEFLNTSFGYPSPYFTMENKHYIDLMIGIKYAAHHKVSLPTTAAFNTGTKTVQTQGTRYIFINQMEVFNRGE